MRELWDRDDRISERNRDGKDPKVNKFVEVITAFSLVWLDVKSGCGAMLPNGNFNDGDGMGSSAYRGPLRVDGRVPVRCPLIRFG